MIDYAYSDVTKEYQPSMYPGERSDKWSIPEGIQNDFSRLNSIIENKYGREFLKICSFYNKMFPTLKSSDWVRNSYNVPPFTYNDQERADTGTGISSNYLKLIIDQITSRLGTLTFQPKLLSEEPTLEYIVYKDEAERLLRKVFRNGDFNRVNTEVFHDAAVLGYSHVLVDPYTSRLVKVNDFEVGMYESQFNKGDVLQLLYRDYAFPTANIEPYLEYEDKETVDKTWELVKDRSCCDFKMFIDAKKHESCVVIGGTALSSRPYPWDEVLVRTFQWDVGFTKVTTTSLFDLLYPLQREINKVNAKIQQMIRMYKGATPVFNSDVDLSVKSISNGSGECLYVDSSRPVDTLMTVINPTPLDSELTAQITEHKTQMYELAGIQQISFDMENMRSAAAVVALDQTRDTTFQAQLQGIAQFDKETLTMYLEYLSKKEKDGDSGNTDWPAMYNLVRGAFVELKPVHLNDPLGNEDSDPEALTPDYIQLTTSRFVLKIVRGEVDYDSLPYWVNRDQMNVVVATYLVKFSALGLEIPETVQRYLLSAFVDAVKSGKASLVQQEAVNG